ncbi:hypothetical protein FJR41_016130 [Dolichospermum planctonicum UHCC 0167]|jgi:hypothetical protein|uniref:hypothetical protein n=1 Tax=Dolichospermum planctonicum TaxID=136072 RepID=UPI0020C30519|nr:hypothetical protein [Dolichospermum planctonicum]MCW9682302.1 hypothetical protein [Dolichospermum planctonicum UHCC 0167]
METMNYPELVTTVLARHTENHLAKVTELQLILYHQEVLKAKAAWLEAAKIEGKPIPPSKI